MVRGLDWGRTGLGTRGLRGGRWKVAEIEVGVQPVVSVHHGVHDGALHGPLGGPGG